MPIGYRALPMALHMYDPFSYSWCTSRTGVSRNMVVGSFELDPTR